MPKLKTSISISEKTLQFLTREGRPTSDQIGRDAEVLKEILHLVDTREGDCPLGHHIKSLCRLRAETDG